MKRIKKSRIRDCFQERAREPIRGDKLSKKPMQLIDAGINRAKRREALVLIRRDSSLDPIIH